MSRKIIDCGIEEVKVRSPLTCELIHGICIHCYGMDLGRGKMVELGAGQNPPVTIVPMPAEERQKWVDMLPDIAVEWAATAP